MWRLYLLWRGAGIGAILGEIKCRKCETAKDLLESFHCYQNGSHPKKTVTIKMKDGTIYEKTQRTHKGHPLDMLSREEFCDLFRREASFALTKEQVEQVIDFVLNLEKVKDVSSIHELLSV